MHPFLPFAALPLAALAAWFAASNWSDSDPLRYRVAPFSEVEYPSTMVDVNPSEIEKADINVKVFLPHVPPKQAPPPPTIVLQSVMASTDIRLATINGRVVQEGDSIEGYLVGRIAVDGVDLFRNGGTRKISMRSLHDLPKPTVSRQKTVAQISNGKTGEVKQAEYFWKVFAN